MVYSWSRCLGASRRNSARGSAAGMKRYSLLTVLPHLQHDPGPGAGLEDVGVEGLVLLLVDEDVRRRAGAQLVAVEAVPAQGLRVLAHVEQGAVVLGPGEVVGGRGDALLPHLARGQVLEVDGADAAPRGVGGEGEHVLARVHAPGADVVVVVALGQGVDVEEDLLLCLHRAAAPAVDGVLLPVLVARVVEVLAAPGGRRGVGLLDAALDLLEEPLLQRLGVGHHRPGVVVLGLQVGRDLGVVALAQPVVVVDAHVAVGGQLVGAPLGRRGGHGVHLHLLLLLLLGQGRGGRDRQRRRQRKGGPHARTCTESGVGARSCSCGRKPETTMLSLRGRMLSGSMRCGSSSARPTGRMAVLW